jgi:hypothetical protein
VPVLELRLTDAQPDDRLVLAYQPEWSKMRTGRSATEIYHYSVISDSGKFYETELFINDSGRVCGYCACAARVVCRHLKACLADLIEIKPEFGQPKKEETDVNQ